MAAVFDTAAAQAFKDEQDAAIKLKEEQAEALTGVENMTARMSLLTEACRLRIYPRYVDADHILRGFVPPNGAFRTNAHTTEMRSLSETLIETRLQGGELEIDPDLRVVLNSAQPRTPEVRPEEQWQPTSEENSILRHLLRHDMRFERYVRRKQS